MASTDFKYSSRDFVWEVSNDTEAKGQYSRFDQVLRSKWDEAVEKGYFRYKLHSLPSRVLEGPHGFLAQMNVGRATARRQPQEIQSTKQPYKPEEFNFNKVRQHEILMEMHSEDPCSQPLNGMTQGIANDIEDESTKYEGREKCQVIINISPLEYGNVLLVPSPHLCQPQVLTLEMITTGIEAVLLSSSRAFKVGFNSLCSYASVNHLHMHAYYVNHRIPTEYWPTKEVIKGRLHETVGWPGQAFVFQLNRENYSDVCSDLYAAAKHLQDRDIAHNMFFTRGCTLGPNPQEDGKTVRLFLWPRLSLFGRKASDGFNSACFELAGHIPVKVEERYNQLTDKQCSDLLEGNNLSEEDYGVLKEEMKSLLQ